tara:strand:+ start:2370 stop:3764 length:1395 start_codon:yes stop_codon:yes gene_type:complete
MGAAELNRLRRLIQEFGPLFLQEHGDVGDMVWTRLQGTNPEIFQDPGTPQSKSAAIKPNPDQGKLRYRQEGGKFARLNTPKADLDRRVPVRVGDSLSSVSVRDRLNQVGNVEDIRSTGQMQRYLEGMRGNEIDRLLRRGRVPDAVQGELRFRGTARDFARNPALNAIQEALTGAPEPRGLLEGSRSPVRGLIEGVEGNPYRALPPAYRGIEGAPTPERLRPFLDDQRFVAPEVSPRSVRNALGGVQGVDLGSLRGLGPAAGLIGLGVLGKDIFDRFTDRPNEAQRQALTEAKGNAGLASDVQEEAIKDAGFRQQYAMANAGAIRDAVFKHTGDEGLANAALQNPVQALLYLEGLASQLVDNSFAGVSNEVLDDILGPPGPASYEAISQQMPQQESIVIGTPLGTNNNNNEVGNIRAIQEGDPDMVSATLPQASKSIRRIPVQVQRNGLQEMTILPPMNFGRMRL